MDITELTLRLMLIFIPGILTTLMIDLFTIHKKWEAYEFIVYTFLSGLLSYIFLQVGYFTYIFFYNLFPCCDKDYASLLIWSNFTANAELPYFEIAAACVISFVLGFLLSASLEKKILGTFASKLGITLKYGEESLFYNFLRQDDVSALYVRDRECNRIYHGFIERFSEDDKIHELLLVDVDVYSTEGIGDPVFLYNAPKLYICRAVDSNLHIEVPPEEI